MEATYESNCDYCDDHIEEGDSISHIDPWGWIHAACATEIEDDEAGDE
jgi:hypothetical protein